MFKQGSRLEFTGPNTLAIGTHKRTVKYDRVLFIKTWDEVRFLAMKGDMCLCQAYPTEFSMHSFNIILAPSELILKKIQQVKPTNLIHREYGWWEDY
jgi:hypothetical protein